MGLMESEMLRHVRVVDPGHVRVAFSIDDGGEWSADFECLVCSSLVDWVLTKDCWICRECSYALPLSEAEEIVTSAIRLLSEFKKDVRNRRKGRWDWLMFWRRREGLSP